MNMSLSLLLLMAACFVAIQAQKTNPPIQYIQGVLRDQAPEEMLDCTALTSSGKIGKGSCGEANGGKGFAGTDFQMPIGYYKDEEYGLVGKECNAVNGWFAPNCAKIGADRTPVYAKGPGQSPWKNIHSAETFKTWFHDSDKTRNVIYEVPLKLGANGVYTYSNSSQFPLDNLGWKDYCGNDENKPTQNHNYGYCFEAHFKFGYTGSEVFQFTGDDDVWVFIDDRLVIDLGSLHKELSRSLTISDIAGLVPSTAKNSSSYKFDFFYCERHTIYSNMKISTSLVAFCSFTDWCGVCEGNGQSCCTKELIDKYCDDNNLCTQDLCGVQIPPAKDGCQYIHKVCNTTDVCNPQTCNPKTGNCEVTPVVCNDNNPCTTDRCDSKLGCQFIDKNCDDKSACTTDSCSPTTGACINAPITCDDKTLCTADSCDKVSGCKFIPVTCPTDKCVTTACSATGGCSNTSIVCNDNDACTVDACDPKVGCTYTKITCDDKSLCTLDSCSKTSGCVFTPISCNDSNACTTDSCSASSGCSYAPITCPAQKCFNVACDKNSGCTSTAVNCDDKNPCTNDICDVSSGLCKNTPIICDDKSACTSDSCVNGVCQFLPRSCIDTDECTINSCVNATGCAVSPKICDDGKDCTTDECVSPTGCKYTPITCNDNDACTADSCKEPGGCSFTAIDCDDDDACTFDACDRVKGCTHTKITCDDKSACTTDTCDKASGCTYTPIVCDDRDLCTNNTCVPATGCVYPPITCDDGLKCTSDSCVPATGCQFTPKVCTSTDPCQKGTCNAGTGNCDFTKLFADCSNCTLNPPDCVTGVDKCFPKVCNPSNKTCIPDTPVNCDDGSKCTIDTCVSGTGACKYTNVLCNDNDACTVDTCDAKAGCIYTRKVCNDGNPCTVDKCEVNGTCSFTPKSCDDGLKCTIDTCNTADGTCKNTPTVCNDNNLCTTDSCNPSDGQCKYDKITCNDNLACTDDTCDPAKGCSYKNKTCEDKNVCTTDSCTASSGACLFQPINCATQLGATLCDVVTCDVVKGCSKTPMNCSDNNPCTDDSCNAGVCVNTPKPGFCAPCADNACLWTNSCEPQICNTATLKCETKKETCDDKSACTTDTCDGTGPTYKCNFAPVSCPTTDLCKPVTCNATTGCVTGQVLCDDGNKCTTDTCETKTVNGVANATCVFTPVVCASPDLCNPATCDLETGQCLNKLVVCDDNNKCTDDTCSAGSCVFTPKTCSQDPCNPEVCNPDDGTCVSDPLDCNDNNPCTIDTLICVVDNATNTRKQDCDHYQNVTVCDDGNFCTNDICDSSVQPGENPCRYTNVTCAPKDACHMDSVCIPASGCTVELKECAKSSTNATDWCQLTGCDPRGGCTSEPRFCPNRDVGCFEAICNNATQTCSENRKGDFGSSKGKGGIICPLLYDKKAKAAAITGGALAGVIIGAVAAAALIGFGGKAGYDYLMAKNSPMGPVASNPLYTQAATSGNNALYSP